MGENTDFRNTEFVDPERRFTPPPSDRFDSRKEISSKSWQVAAALALVFGAFGVHNFYLGYKKKAIIQLVCTLLFFGMPISLCWAIAEAIMLICGTISEDGQGKLLERKGS